jgi:DNA-directed RNA polymerase subunit RPC12/RpoP
MAEKRKMWRNVVIALFVLAVVLAFGNRFLPKPVLETEEIVEKYLLTRTGIILGAGIMGVLGLLTMFNKLRCPHCGAFGLKQIQICTNCGKDLDAPVEEVSEEVETAEESAQPEIAEASEAAESVQEQE